MQILEISAIYVTLPSKKIFWNKESQYLFPIFYDFVLSPCVFHSLSSIQSFQTNT
jgi:hypothetical protein